MTETKNTPARNTPARAPKAPAPAAADKAEATVKDLVRDNWQAIQAALPETMDGRRFAGLVFNSVRRTPRLAEATASSLAGALLNAAALGLEVDTPLGEAYLLPYRRRTRDGGEYVEAQLVVGYQGLLRLCRQHPSFRSVSSGWVGANDHFEYRYGTDPHLEHTPALGDRGDPVAVWAAYSLRDGTGDFVVLSPAEVAALRGKDRSDVADPQHWMERKTALKQVLKTAPKSARMSVAMQVDEQSGPGPAPTITAIDPDTGEITAG